MINNFAKIESKWQKAWEQKKAFVVKEGKDKKKKFYVLEMYPYPSASGLHMGHAFNYTIGDVYSRFKRMNGFNVLYPMGFDSFGLPAENAAIKAKSHPKIFTEKAIKNYIKQMKELGLSYDWTRELESHKPDYYKWDQWIFLKMFEKGLAYRKKAPVNWCKKCKTVLANEQVHNGKCWRHEDTDVEVKYLEQWFLKITDYADELNDFSELEKWPDVIKKLQKNWIGKSHGTEIEFEINGQPWKIFTTRPDTIYGVTFMVISAQHPKLMELVTTEQKKKVESFLKKIKSTKQEDMDKLEKEGVFTGSYAINPLTKEKVPIYTGNFVVADYGSGMVMAVPAHDQRDYEFAMKYGIKIKEVIKGEKSNLKERAYTNEGVLINSDKFNGLNNKKAIEEITNYLESKKLGKKVVQFKLRDWLVSRQRFWGTPIPIVYCDKCGVVPVDEKDLPVKLPENLKFNSNENPLKKNDKFLNTKCPKCKGKAKRETDTMDTFVNSSWYYLRYCDNKNNKKIFDSKKANYWCPVDFYIGGKEHACMHLIYIRFYTKFLRDLGLLKFNEPAVRLFNQGMLHGKDGEKMSKSKGNVVLPEQVSKKYGIDTARLFLVSQAKPDKDIDWDDKGIEGSLRFINRVISFVSSFKFGKSSELVESKVNKTIKDVSLDIENIDYNLAVIKIRQLFDVFSEEGTGRKDIESFLKMLSVFCPHICEELWNKLGNKSLISLSNWPKADEKKINEKLEMQEQMISNLISDIAHILKIIKEKQGKDAKIIKIFVIPKELCIYKNAKEKIKKAFNINSEILSIVDSTVKDKVIKAKPGKPGIYVE